MFLYDIEGTVVVLYDYKGSPCVRGRPNAFRLSLNSLDHHFGRHG